MEESLRAAVPGRGRARVPVPVVSFWAAVAVMTLVLGGQFVPPAKRLLPGLATSAQYRSEGVSPAERAWLEQGLVPGAETPWATMTRYALIDLHRMVPSPPARTGIAAGAAEKWAYTWPRDSAFAAVAMARTGHPAEAELAMRFLERVQEADGGFEARYLLDGSGPPDGRQRQTDGAGWVLWALDDVSRSVTGPHARETLLLQRSGLLNRASDYLLAVTAQGRRLPAPSPDYWEVSERRVTLGTVAPLLAGLQAAARMYEALGETDRARQVSLAASRFEDAVVAHFGPGGYHRYGDSGGADAAICFLMPPFVSLQHPEPVLTAWREYQVRARRPAGGLAPGVSWHADGISWTPETALVAFTAASSDDRMTAEHWLRWLDTHRTTWESIPEKVLPDGSPAGPAPLTWSAALAVLTVQLLDER